MVQRILGISQDNEANQIRNVTVAAEAYEAGCGSPPPHSIDDMDFSVHLDVPVQKHLPTHLWNVAVGELLIKQFRLENPTSAVDDVFLKKQFDSRLIRLARCKRVAEQAALHPELREGEMVRNRRTQHRIAVCRASLLRDQLFQLTMRAQLWHSRKASARSVSPPKLQRRLMYILSLLTSSSMSSDEELTGDPHKTCLVVRKEWRNPDVVGILKWLDFHRRLCLTGEGSQGAGSIGHPRKRGARENGPISTTSITAGLPSNFYHPEWYTGLKRIDRVELVPIDEVALPLEIFSLPTNAKFLSDPNDSDDYWRPIRIASDKL